MISTAFADAQIRRMRGIPYFTKIGAEGFAELIRVAVETARTEAELSGAITALLNDTARASNAHTNVPPTPGELLQWIRSQQPEDQYAEQGQRNPGDGAYCDRCRDGRPPGWVTVQRSHRGQMYTYSGKCPACNPGWYGAPNA